MIKCPHCGREFSGEKLNARHLSKCNPALHETVPPCLCGHVSTSLTQMKRHRVGCAIWQSRDETVVSKGRREATFQERYGVSRLIDIEGVAERRAQTCLERYGAENPFSRESSVFDKVQQSMDGKRPILKGQDNPFAWESTKEKLRATNLERYGAENPQQVPEIRARTCQTNLERYGAEEMLSSPEIRVRIRATCEERYGGPGPSCSLEVQAKAQETNLGKYGVPWTCMNPEVRRKQMDTHFEKYGGVHFFASPEGLAQIRASMVAKYGVDHPAKIEGFWGRQVKKFFEHYGVAHPLQLAEFLEKRRETCQEKYGVDHPLQNADIMAKVVATCWERYGVAHPLQNADILQKSVITSQAKYGSDFFMGSAAYREWSQKLYGTDHPMQNKEFALRALENACRPGPNRFESRVGALETSLFYTGDGSFWRWLPALKHHKNPDFIVPGPVEGHPLRNVTKAIECFGSYWHSRIFTGKAPFDHEQELITAFREIGIDCLVIWESEVKNDPESVKERLTEFLARPALLSMVE
jgi:hypothetical protein